MPLTPEVETLVGRAKGAAANILAAVDQVMAGSSPPAAERARDEAGQVVLALIAAVIAADGVVAEAEDSFALEMAKGLRDSAHCQAYVAEYASKWKELRLHTPLFLSAALKHDRVCRTKYHAQMVADLRTIAHCVALADGEISKREKCATDPLLDKLAALFRQTRWTVSWDDDSTAAVRGEFSYRRDEFGARPSASPTLDSRVTE